jgi:hypothetical protein
MSCHDCCLMPHASRVRCCRWNSTFYMMRRCLLLREAIEYALMHSVRAEDEEFFVPEKRDWDVVEQLCRLLMPFQVATDHFQGQHYPTLGSVSRYITQLRDLLAGDRAPVSWRLLQPHPSRGADDAPLPAGAVGPLWTDLAVEVLEVYAYIKEDLEERWADVCLSDLMGVAAVTHPAHKKLGARVCSTLVSVCADDCAPAVSCRVQDGCQQRARRRSSCSCALKP